MLIGTHRGLNAHISHPLSNLFRTEPSWVPDFRGDIDSYLKAIEGPSRIHPVFPYAVFDTAEQVFEKWPWIVTDPNLYIVSITVIKKADQEPVGGWRWHKWGDYLGDQEPQCEYLYDEPEITQATIVNIFEIDTDKPGAVDAALSFTENTVAGEYRGE